jgi:hypothetical protein
MNTLKIQIEIIFLWQVPKLNILKPWCDKAHVTLPSRFLSAEFACISGIYSFNKHYPNLCSLNCHFSIATIVA